MCDKFINLGDEKSIRKIIITIKITLHGSSSAHPPELIGTPENFEKLESHVLFTRNLLILMMLLKKAQKSEKCEYSFVQLLSVYHAICHGIKFRIKPRINYIYIWPLGGMIPGRRILRYYNCNMKSSLAGIRMYVFYNPPHPGTPKVLDFPILKFATVRTFCLGSHAS